MYCNGTCEYLDIKHHQCLKDGEKLSYSVNRGPQYRFTVHSHQNIKDCDLQEKEIQREQSSKTQRLHEAAAVCLYV